MPLHVVSVDDQVPPGSFLDAFFRHGVDKVFPRKGVGREHLRPLYSLIAADRSTLKFLLELHGGLLYCPLDDPIPLALRPSLLAALSNIHLWAKDMPNRHLVVFDSHAIELRSFHQGRGYAKPQCVHKRRLSPHVDVGLDSSVSITWPGQEFSLLRSVYEQLLTQFFCDAFRLEVWLMGEPQPANTAVRATCPTCGNVLKATCPTCGSVSLGHVIQQPVNAAGRAIQTTNDVNRVVVVRMDEQGEEIQHSVFAKFGAPYRLEREFANFNRLTAAVAHELRDRPNDRVHMRRLFGYGHLSDAFRPIAESSSDFLGLFVASWHSHTDPGAGREKRDGRLDHLLVRDCTDYEDPRLVQLIEQICKTLSVLQGKWSRGQDDGRSYDRFFQPCRVLRLNFNHIHAHAPGSRAPQNHTIYQIHQPELLASQRQQTVDRLDCRLEELPEEGRPDARQSWPAAHTISPHESLRLILKGDTLDSTSEVVAVISHAYEKPVREFAQISIQNRWLSDKEKYKGTWFDQLKCLVCARIGPFNYMGNFRNEIIGRYERIYSEINSRAVSGRSHPQSVILAPRVHGDLYLVNILWSRESDDDLYDFSIIDFEKMEFNAPAAWDYVILELSLRFHWFLERFTMQLREGSDWHDGTNFHSIDKRIGHIEQGLIALSPVRLPDVSDSLRVGEECGPKCTRITTTGLELLRKSVKAVRAGFLSLSRQLPGISDEEARADYNRAILMAAASRAIGRHPDDYPTLEGVLRLLWMSHMAVNAIAGHYRLSPDGP
jgi:hypothetical protein